MEHNDNIDPFHEIMESADINFLNGVEMIKFVNSKADEIRFGILDAIHERDRFIKLGYSSEIYIEDLRGEVDETQWTPDEFIGLSSNIAVGYIYKSDHELPSIRIVTNHSYRTLGSEQNAFQYLSIDENNDILYSKGIAMEDLDPAKNLGTFHDERKDMDPSVVPSFIYIDQGPFELSLRLYGTPTWFPSDEESMEFLRLVDQIDDNHSVLNGLEFAENILEEIKGVPLSAFFSKKVSG